MKKRTLLPVIVTTLLLGGCISTSSLVPEKRDTSYYLVDAQSGNMCIGDSGDCISFSIIASQDGDLPVIESAYNQQVVGPNYPRSLMQMLVFPENGSYKGTPIDNSGSRYRIPKNDATNTTWRELKRIYKYIYD